MKRVWYTIPFIALLGCSAGGGDTVLLNACPATSVLEDGIYHYVSSLEQEYFPAEEDAAIQAFLTAMKIDTDDIPASLDNESLQDFLEGIKVGNWKAELGIDGLENAVLKDIPNDIPVLVKMPVWAVNPYHKTNEEVWMLVTGATFSENGNPIVLYILDPVDADKDTDQAIVSAIEYDVLRCRLEQLGEADKIDVMYLASNL